jgi:preprotein translocase subunit SecG
MLARQFTRTSEVSTHVLSINAIIILIQVIASLFLIASVLLHAGRGGGLSDMFGGNVGGSMAGSTVVEKNLDRITVIVALIWTFTTILLAIRLQPG